MINGVDMPESPYGTLMHPEDFQIQQIYFEEAARLKGVQVLFYKPREDKHWTSYSEMSTNFFPPEKKVCIFKERVEQKTMKRFNWVSELSEKNAIIAVPMNLEVERGAVFAIPDIYNPKKGRLFEVIEISTVMIAPASYTCLLVPLYENTVREAQKDYSSSGYNFVSVRDNDPNMVDA